VKQLSLLRVVAQSPTEFWINNPTREHADLAIAQVLFGKHDPEGRLPVTFDRSWKDSA
jgi:hypothetical protein